MFRIYCYSTLKLETANKSECSFKKFTDKFFRNITSENTKFKVYFKSINRNTLLFELPKISEASKYFEF